MNPLIRERFFVALANNAKKDDVKPVRIHHVSPKNAKRIQKYRESKKASSAVHHLKSEVDHHKIVNNELRHDLETLQKTVNLLSHTLDKHEKRKEVAKLIIQKKTVIEDLKRELNALKVAVLEAKDENDLSSDDFSSISSYIEKLD